MKKSKLSWEQIDDEARRLHNAVYRTSYDDLPQVAKDYWKAIARITVSDKAKDDALIVWMNEVTSLLSYQPEVPQKHKQDLCEAMNAFLRAVKG